MRTRIAYKLAAISLVVALPLLMILALSFVSRYETRVELVEQERVGYARLAAQAFQSLVTDACESMRLIGEHSLVMGGAASKPGGMMDAAAKRYPADYILMANTRGRVVASSDPTLIGKNFAASEAFGLAMTSEDGSGIEPTSRGLNERVGFHIAQRIDDGKGKTAGIMMMYIDVEKLDSAFPVEVPVGGISIIDSDGHVVYQNEDKAFAMERARWGDRYPFVKTALEGQIAPSRDFDFPNGETRIGAFVPIEPIGWAAGSSVDQGVALASYWRDVRVVFPLATAISLFGLLAAAVISARVRRALRQLAAHARRIGTGDLDTPVSLVRDDEIGDVASSLERARVNLKRFAEENARLYEAEHDVAEKLQEALLSLPARVEGVEYAVRYRSATDTARVGGDFYDIFPLDVGRVGITIGDMAGHGIDAAVLTSLVKTAIRVRASEPNPSAAEVVATANQVLYNGSHSEMFATVLFAILDTQTGDLSFTNGGHPPGAIVSPAGVRRLSACSSLIGAFPHVAFSRTNERLDPGEVLFLYTDGLIEARRDRELYGEARLFELLTSLHGLPPDKLVRDVFEDVSRYGGGRLNDDVAILAICRQAQ